MLFYYLEPAVGKGWAMATSFMFFGIAVVAGVTLVFSLVYFFTRNPQ